MGRALVVPIVVVLLLVQRLTSLQAEVPGGDQTEQKAKEGELTAEEKGLRDKYWKQLWKLDEVVDSAQDKFGLDLIRSKKEKEPWPKEKLTEAAQVFSGVEQKAAQLRKTLNDEGPFQGERARKAVNYAQNYALACDRYFNYLDQLTRINIDAAEFKKLEDQWKKVKELRGKLQVSPVWR